MRHCSNWSREGFPPNLDCFVSLEVEKRGNDMKGAERRKLLERYPLWKQPLKAHQSTLDLRLKGRC